MNVPNKKHKLGPKIVDFIFLGCAAHSVGYRFLIINSGVSHMHVGTIMESRDSIFFESEIPIKSTSNISSHESINSHKQFIPIEQSAEPQVHYPEEDGNIVTQKSKRQMKVKSFGDDYIVYLVDDTPTTIKEAFSSPDVDLWKETIRNEIDSIMSHGTWELVE